MAQYKVLVTHLGQTVRAYPTAKDTDASSFEETCKRIGMMVMSSGISNITVYRDGQVYRNVEVKPLAEAESKTSPTD